MAFSVEVVSLGSPSTFHWRISKASAKTLVMVMPSVTGISRSLHLLTHVSTSYKTRPVRFDKETKLDFANTSKKGLQNVRKYGKMLPQSKLFKTKNPPHAFEAQTATRPLTLCTYSYHTGADLGFSRGGGGGFSKKFRKF